MRRYIVLLLITGTVWAQTGLDKLVLKDGTEYLGEYSSSKGRIVYFKPQNALASQPVPFRLIKTLQLKDGTVLMHNGEKKLTVKEILESKGRKKLTFKEYENLTIEVKAIYDANGNARKWLLYPLLTGFTFGTSIGGSMVITHDDPWENILAMIGISITSLALPYYGLKHLDKKQDVEISPKDIQRYKRIYSEEFKKRKSKNIVKGFGLLGLTAAAGFYIFLATFSLDEDFYFGP